MYAPSIVRFLTALLLACGTLSIGSAARAMTCTEPQDPVKAWAAEFARADVVFQGRALSIDQELATTFDVERVFKGIVGKRVVITTYRNKYIRIEPPGRFVVFAYLDGAGASPRVLTIRGCMSTLSVPWPAALDPILARPAPPSDAGAAEPEAADASAADASAADASAADASAAGGEPSPRVTGREPAPSIAPSPPHAGCASCSVARGSDLPAPPGAWLFVAAVWVATASRRYGARFFPHARRGSRAQQVPPR